MIIAADHANAHCRAAPPEWRGARPSMFASPSAPCSGICCWRGYHSYILPGDEERDLIDLFLATNINALAARFSAAGRGGPSFLRDRRICARWRATTASTAVCRRFLPATRRAVPFHRASACADQKFFRRTLRLSFGYRHFECALPARGGRCPAPSRRAMAF